MSSKRELNPKQQRFLELYMATGNAAEAVRQAGYNTKYPDKVGGRLLKVPAIRESIGKHRVEVEQKTAITFEYKLNKLNVIANDPLTSPETRIKAIEVMNKMQGDNAPEKKESQVTLIDERTRLIFDETQKIYNDIQHHRYQ